MMGADDLDAGREAAAAPRSIDGQGPCSAYLSFVKIKTAAKLGFAAKHNLREIAAELREGGRIDSTRRCLNEVIAGPATALEVAALARGMVAAAYPVKLPRRDAVLCIEFMVSLPADHGVDEEAFFTATLAWLGRRFGGVGNVVSAVVHRDEDNPHMHVLLVPLVDGGLRGSEAIGGKVKVRGFYRDFDLQIGTGFGLKPIAGTLREAERARAASCVVAALKRLDDPCLTSGVWPALNHLIEMNPLPLAVALGIDAGRQPRAWRERSFTDIMISKGKGSQDREIGA